MGIGKLSWKKIWKYLWKIIGGFVVLVGLIKGWDVVLSILDFMKNVVLEISRFLISNIGRDILLFVLVVILFWLVRRKMKARSIPPQAEKSEGEKEKWKFDWNLRHDYILDKISEAEEEVAMESLIKEYTEKFPDDSETEKKLIIYDLEQVDLIIQTRFLGEKRYSTTGKGRRRYMKGMRRRHLERFMGLRKK